VGANFFSSIFFPAIFVAFLAVSLHEEKKNWKPQKQTNKQKAGLRSKSEIDEDAHHLVQFF
jgi:hypothetical protein